MTSLEHEQFHAVFALLQACRNLSDLSLPSLPTEAFERLNGVRMEATRAVQMYENFLTSQENGERKQVDESSKFFTVKREELGGKSINEALNQGDVVA